MATLIPSITTCKFDSSGESRFSRLLEAKLKDGHEATILVNGSPMKVKNPLEQARVYAMTVADILKTSARRSRRTLPSAGMVSGCILKDISLLE